MIKLQKDVISDSETPKQLINEKNSKFTWKCWQRKVKTFSNVNTVKQTCWYVK